MASSVSREKDENRNVNRNLVVGLSEPKKKTMTGLFKVYPNFKPSDYITVFVKA